MTSAPAPVRLAFAFTDIESSTRLLERLGAGYAIVLGDHAEIIRAAIAAHAGREVDTQGDAFFAVFPRAEDALRFAVDVQRGLASHPWPAEVTVRVRIGLHAGEAIPTRTGWVGMDVHHAARVAAAAHGGQVLCSGALAAAIADTRAASGSPDDPLEATDPSLVPLGSFSLKDIREPVELLQAAAPGLPADFPPPRTLDAPDEPPAPGDPPYPGLVPFGESDAARFFGREGLVADLVERLGRDGFLAIVGASGSGKSSLLRAGLVPAVRARLAAAGEPDGRIVALTPGDHPAAALADSLASLPGPPHLVAVDQLEELVTLCRDPDERAAFVARLVELVDAGSTVAVALRADLYDAVAGYARLRDLVAAHQAYPGPLTGDDLRAAIEGPAAAGGWRLAPGLADLVIADLGDEPGALPLLAHALRETWERRRGTTLVLRGYLEAGGVRGAIARSAERLTDALDDRELAAAQAILLRLVRPGDDGPDTRRRAPTAELLAAGPDSALARGVLDHLVAARLVVVDGLTAEVAHEALIREWPRLRAWLDADRDAFRLGRAVTEATADWHRAADDASLLWRGGRLETALAWLATHGTGATPDERAFLEASRTRERAEATEREAMRARELDAARRAAEAERARADEAARAAQRLRRRAAGLAGLLVASIVLAGLAFVQLRRADEATADARTQADLALQRQVEADDARAVAETQRTEAERQARVALSRQLAAQSVAERASPDRSLLLATHAVATAPTTEARSSLFDALGGAGRLQALLARATPAYGLVFSEDGATVRAVGLDDGRVLAWDTATGARTEQGHVPAWDRNAVGAGAFPVVSRDGRIGAVLAAFDRVIVGDVASGDIVAEVRSPEGFLGTIALSPDGALLATAENVGAGLWDARTGARLADLRLEGQEDSAIDLAFSNDGRSVAWTSWDGSVGAWDLATQAAREMIPRGSLPHRAVAFSPDGTRIAAGRDDGVVSIRDRASGDEVLALGPGAAPDLTHLAFLGDGRRLATAGFGPTIEIWDTATGAPVVEPMTLENGSVPTLQSLAGSPDGSTLASVDFEGTVALWDADRPHALASTILPPIERVGMTLDPGGDVLTVVRPDGAIEAWDLASRQVAWGPVPVMDPISADELDRIPRLAVSPSGDRFVLAEQQGPAQQWDPRTGARVGGPMGGSGPGAVTGMAYSPDGSLLVTGTQDGRLERWDAATGASLGPAVVADTPEASGYWEGAEWFSEYIENPVFSPDGRLIATAGARSAVLWDAATGRQLGGPLGGFGSSVFAVAFSPDGRTVAGGGWGGQILVFDVSSREQIAELTADGIVGRLAFDPTGRRLLVSANGALELWDLVERRRIGEPFAGMDGTGATYTPDGRVRTTSASGSVLEWTLDETGWRTVACRIAGRDLTQEEWQQLAGAAPYRETCP